MEAIYLLRVALLSSYGRSTPQAHRRSAPGAGRESRPQRSRAAPSAGRRPRAAGAGWRASSTEEAVQVAQVVAERRSRRRGRDGHDERDAVPRFPVAPARPQREARAEHHGGTDEQAGEGDHGGWGPGTRDSQNPTGPPLTGTSG